MGIVSGSREEQENKTEKRKKNYITGVDEDAPQGKANVVKRICGVKRISYLDSAGTRRKLRWEHHAHANRFDTEPRLPDTAAMVQSVMLVLFGV